MAMTHNHNETAPSRRARHHHGQPQRDAARRQTAPHHGEPQRVAACCRARPHLDQPQRDAARRHAGLVSGRDYSPTAATCSGRCRPRRPKLYHVGLGEALGLDTRSRAAPSPTSSPARNEPRRPTRDSPDPRGARAGRAGGEGTRDRGAEGPALIGRGPRRPARLRRRAGGADRGPRHPRPCAWPCDAAARGGGGADDRGLVDAARSGGGGALEGERRGGRRARGRRRRSRARRRSP